MELDALLFVLHGLLRDLAATLDATGQAAVRIQVRFRLEEGEHRLPIRLGQPMPAPRVQELGGWADKKTSAPVATRAKLRRPQGDNPAMLSLSRS